MTELSKYARKNMTPEEITEYERDIDDEGYELIESEDYSGYTIELRKSTDPEELDQWRVWNEFNDVGFFTDSRDDADNFIAEIKEEIQDELELLDVNYYDDEEDES